MDFGDFWWQGWLAAAVGWRPTGTTCRFTLLVEHEKLKAMDQGEGQVNRQSKGNQTDLMGSADSTASMDLSALPAAVTDRLEQYFNSRDAEVSAIGEHYRRVVAQLRQFTLGGGKRIRPLYAWLGWHVGGGPQGRYTDAEDPEAVFSVACALELIQACALIHDDIIDASNTRRGAPTVHRVFTELHAENEWAGSSEHFGQAVGILAGDVALSWADDLIFDAGLSATALKRLHAPWRAMRTEVLGGQLLDITAEASRDSRLETAQSVNLYKTAAYTIARPLHIGAALAGMPAGETEKLLQYGWNFGCAFQLRDDLLGVFGDPAVTGKPAGDDLREGKRTVLLNTAIDYWQDKDPAAAEQLNLRVGVATSTAEINELAELIRTSGAIEHIEAEIDRLTAAGTAAIADLDTEDHYRELLLDLGQRATKRVN